MAHVPAAMAQNAPQNALLSLSAVFSGEPKPVRSGITWRIFEDKAELPHRPIAQAQTPTPAFQLAPGSYVVHATYGFASATRRVTVGTTNMSERLVISAGALELAGAVGDSIIPANKISFAVYVPIGNDLEGRLVMANAKSKELIRLPEGQYHIVSTYGDSNAIMRADVKVESAKITQATLNHRAASVTLKLVAKEGGEAFAGTAFSVLTPGGDIIREAIGAYPVMILAEGDYTLIARHDGQVYTREFRVESGIDREIEVMVK